MENTESWLSWGTTVMPALGRQRLKAWERPAWAAEGDHVSNTHNIHTIHRGGKGVGGMGKGERGKRRDMERERERKGEREEKRAPQKVELFNT